MSTHTARAAAVRLLVGIGITDLAFRVAQVAVPLVVLAGTGSAAATGLVAGASGLPVLVSPWWTRRLRHRIRSGSALAACYLVEAASLGTVAAAASLDALSVPLLASAGLGLGCAEALSGPGRDALVADLGDRIGEDTALTLLTVRDFFRRVSMVAGPLVGGLGVATGHGVWLLWIEVLAILVSATLALPVRGVTSAANDRGAADGIWRTVRDRREVLLGWLVRGAGCLLWFGFTLGLSLLGAEHGQAGRYLAVGLAAYGVGSILGSLGVVRLLRVLPVLSTICMTWLVTGLCRVAMALAVLLLQVASGRRAGPGAVPAAEEAGVHEQGEQLVHAGTVGPALRQR